MKYSFSGVSDPPDKLDDRIRQDVLWLPKINPNKPDVHEILEFTSGCAHGVDTLAAMAAI